ncbi:MAG TPA: hemerythrin family protein [Spirochaetota bacterium]|nr:hemerythrin family protein [Spirochaetota bacterium]HNT10820.1 hemerythrin family protein [Spirochaetota bacterium]
MEPFIWTSEYEIGIVDVDRQHRELFRLMDSLSLSLYRGDGKKVVGQVLHSLEEYVAQHFSLEEDLMSRHRYPDVVRHMTQHRQFEKQLAAFKKDYERGGSDSYLALRVNKELVAWWKTHILQVDREYRSYIVDAPGDGAPTGA